LLLGNARVATTAREHFILIRIYIPSEFNCVDRGTWDVEKLVIPVDMSWVMICAQTVPCSAVARSETLLLKVVKPHSADGGYKLPRNIPTHGWSRANDSHACADIQFARGDLHL
jgi:hypothetical protein